jgi:hypothetical protein
MNIGVCIRAKDEQKIIADWTKHYIDMGFDKIIIYDNMSNPPIEETLQEKGILDKNKIQIIIDEYPLSNQDKIYQNCINNNKDLDWLLLCDADEFIYHKNKNIKSFLSQFSQDTCTVLINWLTYGTSNLGMYDSNKTVFEQFIMREEYSHFWNRFVKSFVRPNLIENTKHIHVSYNSNYKIKNVYNEIVAYTGKCHCIDMKLSNDTPVVIVHYMTLDFESMLNKHKRNINGRLLHNDSTKYTIEWYRSSKNYSFKDNVKDMRMCNI